MESKYRPAFPLFLLMIVSIFLVSCSNPQQNYDKGRYEETIRQIKHIKSPTADDLLLKARSYIALGQDDKALESLFLYLSLNDGQNPENREFAVNRFLQLNRYDSLTVMVLLPTDGTEALKALFCAYSRRGETGKASEILTILSRTMDFNEYVSLMLSAPHDIGYIIDIFTAWYGSISADDKDDFISLLLRFSVEVSIPENEAKRLLSLTDLLMNDTYYTEDNIRLSCLLKIKGNILEMLYDKVNARIYWSQAYRLNPDDVQLKDRLQQ